MNSRVIVDVNSINKDFNNLSLDMWLESQEFHFGYLSRSIRGNHPSLHTPLNFGAYIAKNSIKEKKKESDSTMMFNTSNQDIILYTGPKEFIDGLVEFSEQYDVSLRYVLEKGEQLRISHNGVERREPFNADIGIYRQLLGMDYKSI